MLAALFMVAVIAAAVPLSRRLWRHLPAAALGPFERAASVAFVALALAVGIDWALAFAQLFYRAALVGASVALLAAAAVARLSRSPGAPGAPPPPTFARERTVALAALGPVGAWLAYVWWRGTLLFVYLSDGLSYHLPKALLIVRHHGFALFDGHDTRLTTFPSNYEILLADVVALTGGDTLTFAVSVVTFVLFGATVAAMAERWWGEGVLHVTATTLVALAMPPLLLASGAHKNDVLTAAAMLAAVHWGARWAVTAERPALALAIAGVALAVGTKAYAGVLVLALVPCVLWRGQAWRREGTRLRAGEALLWLGGSLLAFLALGGGVYVFNLIAIGRPFGANDTAGGFGAWDHLWKFPVLVFLRGFAWGDDLWIPWLGVRWRWPEYDLFLAPYGTPASLALLLSPWAVWKWRSEGRRDERALASIAVVISFFAALPVRVNEPPVGFFIGISRYVLGLPVILFLWTIAPFVRHLARRERRRHVIAAVAAASACFVFYAVRSAVSDSWAGLDLVRDVLAGRVPARALRADPARAGQIVDQRAPPDAVVAFEGAFDSWVYPIYGASLSREVVFLHSERGPVTIPDRVTWVAIDRWWSCGFGSPEFTDFSQWDHFLEGKPLPADLVLYDQLRADPRFELVYRSDRSNQAVFRRVPSGG